MTPSDNFIRLSRNPAIAVVRPRETASEIARRIREGVKGQPIVEKVWSEPEQERAA